MAGFLITFEGIDYSGKTVQAKLLHQRLAKSGYDTILIRDPGTTRISERIREILLDRNHFEMSWWTELLLYESARAQMVEESIKPALNKGTIIVCDRFYDSTTAYQGYGRKLDLNYVTQANELGACGIQPDITFIIDVEPQQALLRRTNSNNKADRLEKEDHNFHKRVRDGYLQIAKKEPQRCIVVNGAGSVSSIHDKIWGMIKKQNVL